MMYYDVKELVRSKVDDLSIVRQEPAFFKAGNQFLVALPVKYWEHPYFIRDLAKMLLVYAEIFKKMEFLSIEAMKEKSTVEKMVHSVTIFSNTKEYLHFVKKGLPEFLIKWGRTLNKKENKIIKIKKRKSKKLFEHFTIDELLKVFMYIFAFNYDAVKKNNWDLLQKIMPQTSVQKVQDTTYSGIKKKSLEEILPKFSNSPFSKSDLKVIAQQSTTQ